MSFAIAPPRPSAPSAAPAPPRRSRTIWPWLLLVGWAAQAGVRLWLGHAQTAPVAYPDESGYLVAARVLAGGPGADLSGYTFYQGGYPLLLAPIYWVSHDPGTVYRLVIVLNALVGAAVFPLGHLALRRLGLSCRSAFSLAWAAALLPAVTFFGLFALSDAVLPVIVLGWLLALDRFVRLGSPYAAVVASLAAGYAYATHSRGAVIIAVQVAALGLVALRGRSHRRPALIGLVAAAAGYLAAAALNARLLAVLYPDGSLDLGGILAGRLTSLDGQAWAVSGAVGQLWYLITCTWGLAGVGLIAVAAALVRRRTPSDLRIMAAVLLSVTAAMAYASSAALPDEHRVGNFAYGRYLSCVALAYTFAGLATVVRSRTAVRCVLGCAMVLAFTGGWIEVYAGSRLRTSRYIGFDFPEIRFLTGDDGALRLTTASLAALGLLAVFGCLSRWGATTVAAGLLAVNAAAMINVVYPFFSARFAPAPPAAGRVVADYGTPWRARAQLSVAVWWSRIDWYDARHGRPEAGVCTVFVAWPAGSAAMDSWPEHPAAWRPHPVGGAGSGWVAWQDPACHR